MNKYKVGKFIHRTQRAADLHYFPEEFCEAKRRGLLRRLLEGDELGPHPDLERQGHDDEWEES